MKTIKVKYIGNLPFTFHIPGIKGEWSKDEVKELTEEEYEIIKKDKNFEIIKEKEKIKGGKENGSVEH